VVDSVAVAECRSVVVSRRGATLLGPVDLSIRTGEFWGVVGPNGAGKSTLLRAIAGLERIGAGEIESSADRRRIGLLFQHHDFVPELPFTVEDVVRYGRSPRVVVGPVRSTPDRAAVDRALDLLGLEAMRRRLYRELSGGERQKVQLARLVAQEAELLLLDEPTAGLDLDWQERLTALVDELHRRTGVAVVMVTHEVHHLPPCCDQVLLLRGGRAIAVGPPSEVFTAELLSELYGCRMEVTERDSRFFAHSLGPMGQGEEWL
jgi:iron complex transport system ATP-binding protein